MKKKFLALTLAVVMCLSLAIPAFAADRPEKEDEGIVGCYTMTRSGTDVGQFVEKTLLIGYTGNDEWERIQGYNSIKADTTWTVTNTSKEENSYLNIFVMPYENEGDGETYSFSFSEELTVRRDGSFAYRRPMDGEPGPDEVELRNVYPGQSVTFKLSDALECLGRDVSEDMLYCLYINQFRSDSKQFEEADYFYKIGGQGQDPVDPGHIDPVEKFDDINTGDWFVDAVDYVVNNNLFQGMTDTIFAPDTTMNRAMFVVVLARKDGVSDESGASWYEKDVQWAVSKGYYDGKDPEGAISRQEMAVMLYRHAGSPEVSGNLDGFSDASSVTGEVRDAFIWAVQNGYINGMGRRLAPTETATRAQVATIFMRVFG